MYTHCRIIIRHTLYWLTCVFTLYASWLQVFTTDHGNRAYLWRHVTHLHCMTSYYVLTLYDATLRTYIVWRHITYLHCMTPHYALTLYDVILRTYIVWRHITHLQCMTSYYVLTLYDVTLHTYIVWRQIVSVVWLSLGMSVSNRVFPLLYMSGCGRKLWQK